jgi:WD40 repeat protein
LAEDLQRFVDDQPITARPISRTERTWRWTRRNPLLAALFSGIAILSLALTIGSSAFAWKLLQDAGEKERTARLQQIGIYARDMQLIHNSVRNGNYLEAEQQLLKWFPAEGSEDHRGFEWYHLWKACHDPAIQETIAYELMTHDVTFTDENSLAVAWFSNEVSVWDVSRAGQSRLIRQLVNPQQEIYRLRNLPGLGRLLVGDTDGRVIEWNLQSSEKEHTIELGYPTSQNKITWLAVSRDNKRIAISSSMRRVDVWNRSKKEFDKRLEGWNHLQVSAFTSTGDLVVVGEQGGKIEVFEHANWTRMNELSLDADGAMAIAASPTGDRLAIAAYSRSGGYLASMVDLWDTSTWRRVARLPLQNAVARAMEFSPDGSKLVVGDDAGTIFLIDPSSPRVLDRRPGHPEKIVGVSFSPSGERVATVGNDGQVHLWNVSSLTQPSELITRLNEPLEWAWSSVFIDDRTAATTRNEGPVFLWDVLTGETRERITASLPDANVVQFNLSADRNLAAVSYGHAPAQELPSRVEFRAVKTGQPISSRELPRGRYFAKSSFSPDARRFALACLNYAVVLDVRTAEVIREIAHPEWLKGVIFAPDGDRLLTFDFYGMVRVYDARTFELQREMKLDKELVLRIAFSPDGNRMAVVGLDSQIKLFDAGTFEPLPPQFPVLRRYLTEVLFSPDGKRIVTGGIDGKIRIWHAESGDELIGFDVSQGFYPECDMSSDGNSLLVGCGDMAAVFHAADRAHLSKLSLAELNDIGCRGATTEMKLKDEQDRQPKTETKK